MMDAVRRRGTRLLAYLSGNREAMGRLFRFGLVGGAASLTYALVAYGLLTYSALGTGLASSLAYVVAIPVSFVGQKYFTFRSDGRTMTELPKFLVIQVANIILCGVILKLATDIWGLPAIVGILMVVVVVPLASYVLFALLVFTASRA